MVLLFELTIGPSLVTTVSQRPRQRHRALSRRLDRSDWMIQNESRYSNGGSVREATGTSRHNGYFTGMDKTCVYTSFYGFICVSGRDGLCPG